MQSSTTSWHDWVVDPDPLALAQARHIPSGFGVTLKTISDIRTAPGGPPYVASIYTDHSRPVIDRLFRDLGPPGCRDWIEEKQSEARELWRVLGLDLHSNAALPEPLPCQVMCWREQWTIQRHEAQGQVDLLHRSGWSTRLIYTEVGEDGCMGWGGTVPDEWTGRVSGAEASLGEEKFSRLRQEAEILLMEEGFFHCTSQRLAQPFGNDWRTLWTVREREGEQWLVHASGLAVTPVYGVVEDDGMNGWTLQVQPGDVAELDCEMRLRVGHKAWDRLHDQGWSLCVEIGYVAPVGQSVH